MSLFKTRIARITPLTVNPPAIFIRISYSCSNVQKFAPLLRVRAPALMDWNLERAPIDIVTVLDVNGTLMEQN